MSKVSEFLGIRYAEMVEPANLIEHLRRQGMPVEELRKTKTRKWAIREADRINRLAGTNPALFQEVLKQHGGMVPIEDPSEP